MLNYTILAIGLLGLGLLGLVVVENISIQQQQAEAAASIVGQCASSLKNASSSFCHTLR
jgi:hypothetical protein